MADERILQARLIHCAYTADEWATDENKVKVLKSGELGFETIIQNNIIISAKSKVGDGITEWQNLPYVTDDSLKPFIGTKSEYEAVYARGEIPVGTLVYLTDENSGDGGGSDGEDDNNGSSSGGSTGLGTVSVVTTLPLASAYYRGKFLILEKDNSDDLYICLKISSSYQWFNITTADTGVDGEDTENGGEDNETTVTVATLGTAILGQMILGKKE